MRGKFVNFGRPLNRWVGHVREPPPTGQASRMRRNSRPCVVRSVRFSGCCSTLQRPRAWVCPARRRVDHDQRQRHGLDVSCVVADGAESGRSGRRAARGCRHRTPLGRRFDNRTGWLDPGQAGQQHRRCCAEPGPVHQGCVSVRAVLVHVAVFITGWRNCGNHRLRRR